jgi:hypothetical protein
LVGICKSLKYSFCVIGFMTPAPQWLAGFLSTYPVYISMDKLDKKIRRFLVDEGYLFPTADAEIERSLIEAESKGIKIPKHLDDPKIYLCIKKPRPKRPS